MQPRASVHPHGRGDNDLQSRLWRGASGSPPRAWGQSRPDRCVPLVGRFTPTGVGTMRTSRRSLTYSSVHPHGRGDNVLRVVLPLSVGGSPPRAWGQSTRRFAHAPPARFTPTGVGTIDRRVGTARDQSVHPHGRGDNNRNRQACARRFGSPPRAWGQSRARARNAQQQRFTPTGVGTIGDHSDVRLGVAVHPHGRGDNSAATTASNHDGGSPPRAWGQLERLQPVVGHRRFTPTGVGTIGRPTSARPRSTVHPHGRGDNGCIV